MEIAKALANIMDSTTVAGLFGTLDKDHSGTVGKEELAAELKRRGIGRGAAAASQVEQLFNALDADGSGQIEYEELYKALQRAKRGLALPAEELVALHREHHV